MHIAKWWNPCPLTESTWVPGRQCLESRPMLCVAASWQDCHMAAQPSPISTSRKALPQGLWTKANTTVQPSSGQDLRVEFSGALIEKRTWVSSTRGGSRIPRAAHWSQGRCPCKVLQNQMLPLLETTSHASQNTCENLGLGLVMSKCVSNSLWFLHSSVSFAVRCV